jgi:RNA-directed DNA polymerase
MRLRWIELRWAISPPRWKKSVQRLKTNVHDLDPWEEVCDTLNRSRRGWSNCFCYGTRRAAFRSINYYVTEHVRAFLARRDKVQGRGNRRFTFDVIHGGRGVLGLERLPRGAPSWALR